MANLTLERGACSAPFLQLSKFPSNAGYVSGRFCAPVPSSEGTIDCCLPCPITDWVYSDEFDVVPSVANWLTVAGLACSGSLLISYFVLPVKETHRHYLSLGLVTAICLLQLGFIIPLGAKPDQCHDAITPNDMYSDLTCAFSGAFLLFGGFAAISWGFLRSLSIHLQICWQVVPGQKFFWSSIFFGWGIPTLIVAVMLPITGTSYRFGLTCHINHENALADYWGPLLGFAAISTILQFVTFGYCIKVYIKSMLHDSTVNSEQVSSNGLPSYRSRTGSVKTVTAGQAYRRIKKVIALQWRGTAIVLIIIVNVVFLAVAFVQMDSTVTGALKDLSKAEPWLLCLAFADGDKNKCLDEVKQSHLVTSEATVMAVLLMLSLNGIWCLLFLGRSSIPRAWWDLVRRPFAKPRMDFVSVDVRRFSSDPKTYELITSPTSHPYNMPKSQESTVTNTPVEQDQLSPLAQSPRSPSYLENKEIQTPQEAHHYSIPKLSFSSPRPPSAGGAAFSGDASGNGPRSPGFRGPNRSFSPNLGTIGRPYSPARSNSTRSHVTSPTFEWDPTNTHAPSAHTHPSQ